VGVGLEKRAMTGEHCAAADAMRRLACRQLPPMKEEEACVS